METYQTSIILRIKNVYKRRLLSPVIYLMLLAALWMATPVSELVFPPSVSAFVPFAEIKNDHFTYITTTLTDLHFTGYTQKFFGYTNGYYYYTFDKNQCILALLSPDTCEEGLPDIDRVSVHVRILEHFDDYHALTAKLAEDLDWTVSGMQSQVPDYLLSEPGFNKLLSVLLLLFYFASGAYALVSICICAVYILFPVLSPACRKLGLYGNAKKLLAQAEAELSALQKAAAEDMYLTEHFFIVLANDRAAVIPVAQILWIYKHSTLHKVFSYHFSISYTLHITANKRLHVSCPESMKADIDGIIDSLCAANPDILVGFNEQNRQKVQKLSGTFHFTRLLSFFTQKL